jgi:glycosyltransferase involved in cell wall biosynthesis
LKVTRSQIEERLLAAQQVFDAVDLFVAPSAFMAAEYQRLGIDSTKMRISDYGFVPLRRKAREAARAPLRIGYVGTLVWHKGVHVLLEAASRLPAGAYELTIFGALDVFPDYVAMLRRQAAGLPVRFAGAFDRDEAAEIYSRIDVLVVPSLWLENSPLVIHEAFMAGVPVVGARIGGIIDLIDDQRTGLLYDPASPAELEALLRGIIERPERLAALARALPEVKSIADDAREWEAAYNVLLSRPPVAEEA